jgi:glycine hydroxymethyltransferase
MCKASFQEALDKAIMPGTQGGPFMHVIAAKAVAFQLALEPAFKEYQKQVLSNAQIMASTFGQLGYRIVSGGTDNHLFILDLRSKNITGLQAEKALEKVNINVSRSTIPFDTEKPWITSGIRLGTPAITTRGFKEKEIILVAELIDELLTYHQDEARCTRIRQHIQQTFFKEELLC